MLLALAAGCAVTSPSAAKGPARCVHRQEDQLASGPSTGTKPWTIAASIHNNGSCNSWLFEVSVSPFGTRVGSWRSGWGIPAGGSLPGKFRIGAVDEAGNGRQAFGGIVAARVSTIELVTSRGQPDLHRTPQGRRQLRRPLLLRVTRRQGKRPRGAGPSIHGPPRHKSNPVARVVAYPVSLAR